MPLSLSEAAKEVGKSRSAVWRAIKSGRLSATRTDGGEFQIDGAELARVFPPEQPRDVAARHRETADGTAVLQARLEAEQRVSAELRASLADAREDRDRWRGQAERLVLAGPTGRTDPVDDVTRGGFWRRLIGR